MKLKSLLVLIFLLVKVGMLSAQQRITVSPWKMNKGSQGIIQLREKLSDDDVSSPFQYRQIPPQDDNGWKLASLDAEGEIQYNVRSLVDSCLKAVDFTYFETFVDIPANFNIDELVVNFKRVDDGARVYVFNSKCNGRYSTVRGITPETSDLKRLMVKGERNRIVIVQFDYCPGDNVLEKANIQVNGIIIDPRPCNAQ